MKYIITEVEHDDYNDTRFKYKIEILDNNRQLWEDWTPKFPTLEQIKMIIDGVEL